MGDQFQQLILLDALNELVEQENLYNLAYQIHHDELFDILV